MRDACPKMPLYSALDVVLATNGFVFYCLSDDLWSSDLRADVAGTGTAVMRADRPKGGSLSSSFVCCGR